MLYEPEMLASRNAKYLTMDKIKHQMAIRDLVKILRGLHGTKRSFAKSEKRRARRRARRKQKLLARSLQKAANIEPQSLFGVDINHKVSPEFISKIDDFRNCFVQSFNMLNIGAVETASDIKTVFDSAVETFDKAVTGILRVAWVVPICALVCYVATLPDYSYLARGFLAVLAAALPVVYTPVLHLVRDYIDNSTKIEPQSGIFDFKNLKKIISLGTLTAMGISNISNVMEAITGCFSESEGSANLLSQLVSSSKKTEHTASLYANFVQWGLSTVEDVVNAIRTLCGKGSIRMFQTGERMIDEWCERVGDILNRYATGVAELDPDMASELVNLKNQGLALQNEFRFTRDVSNVLNSYMNKFDTFCSHNSAVFMAAKGTRVEPVCLALYGPPGVGKSFICQQLCAYVTGRCIPKEKLAEFLKEPTAQIFQKGVTKFWNGYTGPFAFVLDDLLQALSTLGDKDSELLTLIRAINSWPFPLDFADLENKGKNYFRSRFVLCTTNVENLASASTNILACPGALLRRLHFKYQLGVAPEFCKPGKTTWEEQALDLEKVLSVCRTSEEFPFHAWVVRQHNFDGTKNYHYPQRSLIEVMDEIAEAINNNVSTHQNLQQYYRPTVQRALAGRTDLDEAFLAELGVSVPQTEIEAQSGPVDDPRLLRNVLQWHGGYVNLNDELLDNDALVLRLLGKDEAAVKDAIEFCERVRRAKAQFRQGADNNNQQIEPQSGLGETGGNITWHNGHTLVEENFALDEETITRLLSGDEDITKEVIAFCERVKHSKAQTSQSVDTTSPQIEPQSGLGIPTPSGYWKYAAQCREHLMDTMFPRLMIDVALSEGECRENPEYHRENKLVKTCRHLAEDLVRAAEDARDVLKASMFNPLTLLENPIVCSFLKGMCFGALFALARIALSSIINTFFGKKKVEPQVLPFAKFEPMVKRVDVNIDIQANVGKNLYRFSVYNKDAKTYCDLGNCLGLCLDKCLINTHFFGVLQGLKDQGKIDDECSIKLTNISSNENGFEMTVAQFFETERYSLEDRDFTIVAMPVPCSIRDITSKFVPEHKFSKVSKFNGVLIKADRQKDGYTIANSYSVVNKQRDFLTNGDSPYKITKGFQYDIATRQGDCGSVLLLGPTETWSQQHKICGFHTGGTPALGKGFATAIYAEDIDKLLGMFKKKAIREIYDDPNIKCEAQCAMQGSHMPLWYFHKNPSSPPFTKLVHTDLYGLFGPSTKCPAPIGDFQAYLKAIKKYSGPVKVYDAKEVAMCAHTAFALIEEETKKFAPKGDRPVLTFEEAVVGIESDSFARGLTMGTSAGYCSGATFEGKKTFFPMKPDGSYDLNTDYGNWVRKKCWEVIENARNAIRELHWYQNFPKDEKLPIDKVVNDKKLRIVCGAPIVYTIVFRMYFMKFLSSVMHSRIYNGCAAGINPYQEWGELANHLLNTSEHIVAGDYSAFDASGQPQLYDAILDYINKWYDDGEENALIRRVLWQDLIQSRHIGKNSDGEYVGYQWTHSLPSGHPATTIVNSMYNLLLICICYKREMGATALGDYHKLVTPVVLGDDNIIAIAEKIIARFNQLTITKHMDDLHMKYTDEDKGVAKKPSKSLGEAGFLKRGFNFEDGYVFGNLSLETIKEMCYWCRNTREKETITQSNFETALKELAAHPKEVWDELSGPMLAAYEASGRRTVYLADRDIYRMLFKESELRY